MNKKFIVMSAMPLVKSRAFANTIHAEDAGAAFAAIPAANELGNRFCKEKTIPANSDKHAVEC